MTYSDADFYSEMLAERRAYEDAVARLSESGYEKWAAIYESYEFFDGEYGIALATLERMKREGKLR